MTHSISFGRFVCAVAIAALASAGCVVEIEDGELDENGELYDEQSATTAGMTLVPASDIGSDGVEGNDDLDDLYANVDDGTLLTMADDDESYVRTVPGGVSGSHRVGYAGAPDRPIAKVVVRFRARLLGGSSGTAQVTLFDGATRIEKKEPRSLTTSWSSFAEAFTLSLSSAAHLRTRLEMKNPTGEGVAYTQVLVRVTFAPETPDTTPPTVPANPRRVSTTDTTITIAWDASTDDVAVDSYTVYKDGNPHTTIPATTSPTFRDTGIWPNSTHSYYVTATDPSGNASDPSAIISPYTLPDTTPPTAPKNLVGTFDRSVPSVTLSWGASTDNVQLDHYDIFRASGGVLAKIGTGAATATSYTDKAPAPNATNEYFVMAVDTFWKQSAESNRVRIVTDTQKPTTPTNLQVTATTSSSISLGWTASTDNFPGLRYRIHRDGVLIATPSAASGSTFLDGPLSSGTTYSYSVTAEDSYGNLSDASNTTTGTTR